MKYRRYIGIDYSGAQTSESRLKALQVFAAVGADAPLKIRTAVPGAKNWSRREIAQYCRRAIMAQEPAIIGIDHAFSFPMSYMERYGIGNWNEFLDDFVRHWPTADPHTSVDFLREGNPRSGDGNELRLCEKWTTGTKSVFRFDVQGQVAKSTHAGLPWLQWLRMMPEAASLVHIWPFDGFEVPDGRSVVAEVYPSLFRRRYHRAKRTTDEHDAYAVALWLQEMDRRGALDDCFSPPLSRPEREMAMLEGWILGVR